MWLCGEFTSQPRVSCGITADNVGIWESNYTELQGQYTSNYVSSVNTTLTTSSGTKQASLTSTTLLPYFNSGDFSFISDKTSIVKSLGYYEIKIRNYLEITHPVIIFSYTDRQGADASSQITNRLTNPYDYGYAYPPTTQVSKLYYNTSDKISITNLVNGVTDYVPYNGVNHYAVYSLVKMNNNSTGYIPGQGTSVDQGYYTQFSWYINEIRDWCATTSWVYSPEIPDPPTYTHMGPYNYPLVYTLEAG